MTAHNNNKGILSYWPQIFGISSFVFTAGIVYGKFGQMEERQKAVEARQDRKFELHSQLEKRMIEQEKRTEYYKGLRDGRTETTNKNTNQ